MKNKTVAGLLAIFLQGLESIVSILDRRVKE